MKPTIARIARIASATSIADGSAIPIEERDPREVQELAGRRIVPAASPVRNPAFDVTPAALITAIVTERGIFRGPYHFTK